MHLVFLISYYLLIILISLVFLKSINFKIFLILKLLKKFPDIFSRKNKLEMNYDQSLNMLWY